VWRQVLLGSKENSHNLLEKCPASFKGFESSKILEFGCLPTDKAEIIKPSLDCSRSINKLFNKP
jgi:hypothetical protein